MQQNMNTPLKEIESDQQEPLAEGQSRCLQLETVEIKSDQRCDQQTHVVTVKNQVSDIGPDTRAEDLPTKRAEKPSSQKNIAWSEMRRVSQPSSIELPHGAN